MGVAAYTSRPVASAKVKTFPDVEKNRNMNGIQTFHLIFMPLAFYGLDLLLGLLFCPLLGFGYEVCDIIWFSNIHIFTV